MGRPILGTHHVSTSRVWSVARVRGVTSSILAIIMGGWILRHQHELFRGEAWINMHQVIGGQVDLIAWPILVGGILGLLGLILRSLMLGLASCLIGIVWFGWMGGFVWYANFTDAPNVAAILCLYGLLEYVYRFATIVNPPGADETDDVGW